MLVGVFLSEFSHAQTHGYGSVIGGLDEDQYATSFLDENEQGVRVTVIISTGIGGGGGLLRAGGGRGGVQVLDIPSDTDYLELILNYVGVDPRRLRKGKIQILRIKEVGGKPYMSEEIKREWNKYNFKKQYKRGGPFDLVQPGDIIIIQNKGLFNRPAFDFLADFRFILSLPALALSTFLLIQAFR